MQYATLGDVIMYLINYLSRNVSCVFVYKACMHIAYILYIHLIISQNTVFSKRYTIVQTQVDGGTA